MDLIFFHGKKVLIHYILLCEMVKEEAMSQIMASPPP